jgi:hypothetical protein
MQGDRYVRCVVLARSVDRAASLALWPRSPFVPAPALDLVPENGAYVVAPDHGLWGWSPATIACGLARTFLVAWNLVPGDNAWQMADLRVREEGPHTLIQNVTLYFHISQDRPALPVPIPGTSLLRTETGVGPNPLLTDAPQSEPEDLRAAEIPPGAGKPIYRSSPLTSGTTMLAYTRDTARKRGVDPTLAMAVIATESSFEPYPPDSSAGAMGPMGITPDTARTIGLTNPRDPAANIAAGITLLSIYLKRYAGDVNKTLIAYHSGPGRVSSPSHADDVYIRRVAHYQAVFRRTERDTLINESP